ncbi:MAG: hypothetical protein H7315_07950 [Herminiimonas sp.]|nr:hypothetical protein [Herminiimonas sp.]
MKFVPDLESVATVATLLDENIDSSTFDAAIKELQTHPALMESLMAVQFVSDAMRGNPCPDKRYTFRIMRFIAEAENQRIADEQNDK